MKKNSSILFAMLLMMVLCSCSPNQHSNVDTSAKAIDCVPDEVIYEYVNNRFNPNQRLYKQDPGRTSKPTYVNEIDIYQREDSMIDVDNFIVKLKVTVMGELCTQDVELECRYEFRNGVWNSIETNEIVKDIDWHYSHMTDCWWSGGVGLNYRTFYITDINAENQTMNIIDGNNREYLTSYEIVDDHIEVDVKYDTGKWIICSEGPRFAGNFMIKNN